MKNSKSLPNTLADQVNTLPFKGFKVKLESPKPNFDFYVENKGDGRYRIHAVKKA
jgi:hypothetical protein